MRASGTNVTVVMPVCNGLRWLDDTLSAVDGQRDVCLERIAVDDGSTDGSADLLRRRGWRVLATDRLGPNVARARGLEVASRDLVAFLDQDDLWHPDHLADAADALRTAPRAAAVVGPRVPFSGRRRPRLGGRRAGPAAFDPWAVYPVNLIDTPSMVVVRRRALEAAGGWPADRPLGSDPLLWWRLSVEAPLALLPRRTVGVRRSDQSLSSVSRGRPLEYLRHLRIAAADALARAPAGIGREVEPPADRLLAAVTGIVGAVVAGDGLAAAATALEAALADASDAMVTATVGFWGWLVSPHVRQPPAGAVDPVAAIIDDWPVAAARTRTATLAMVSAVAGPWRLCQTACRGPGPRRVAAAAAAWALAAAARCGRVADPLDLPLGGRPLLPHVEASP